MVGFQIQFYSDLNIKAIEEFLLENEKMVAEKRDLGLRAYNLF